MSAQIEKPAEPKPEMVEIEVDGVTLKAPKGSMIIEATDRAGIDIPRFATTRN
jgi:NADH-quinone oxidoreductase subunit G